FTPLLRRLSRGEPTFVFNFGILASMAVMLGIMGWPAIRVADWAGLGMAGWLIVGYLAVFANAVSRVLLRFSARALPSAKVMAYTYLIPSWVILWELALGHGVPPLKTMIGVALTVLALVLLLKEEAPAPVTRGKAPTDG